MMRRLPLLGLLAFLSATTFGVISACSSEKSSDAPSTDDTGEDASKTTKKKKPAEQEPTDDNGTEEQKDAGIGETGEPLSEACTKDPGAPTLTFDAGADDPIGAENFTLTQALAGFPKSSGTLTAVIATEISWIRCALLEDAAPVTVANFVGLARGTRPYKGKSGTWTTGHFYDGLLWHRVIPDFVIQGGDPLGKGTGGPGYSLPNENHAAQGKGALSMAAGSKTVPDAGMVFTPSGSQFYVVVGTGPDTNYNVFGQCTTKTAIAISNVKTDKNDKPVEDVHITKVEIARCP